MVDFVFYPYSYHLLPNRTEAVLRCQRGFLTLRDCLVIIYGSITLQLYCFKCVHCIESSLFYTFDKVPSGTYFVFSTYCVRIATRLIESIRSHYLPIGSSGYHSLLAAEGMSDNDCQKRTLFSINALSKCLKSIRQYFTSRHSG